MNERGVFILNYMIESEFYMRWERLIRHFRRLGYAHTAITFRNVEDFINAMSAEEWDKFSKSL